MSQDLQWIKENQRWLLLRKITDEENMKHRQHAIVQSTIVKALAPTPTVFYPRIIREFYRTMTSKGVYPPSSDLFQIDGKQGMLNSKMVAKALNIPFTPPNPEFQPITRIEVRDEIDSNFGSWIMSYAPMSILANMQCKGENKS
ncbi:hypothetical protein AAG906_008223 [Vitis piasezkii]